MSNFILDESRPRFYWMIPNNKQGQRILILNIIRYVLLGLTNLILGIYFYINDNNYDTNIANYNFQYFFHLQLFFLFSFQLFLIWDGVNLLL
ncbi:hypothetical protein K502DRAFT_323822, partial [Neoconidiobolus thromboides FSU 785]